MYLNNEHIDTIKRAAFVATMKLVTHLLLLVCDLLDLSIR
jgi:hypothetical protein